MEMEVVKEFKTEKKRLADFLILLDGAGFSNRMAKSFDFKGSKVYWYGEKEKYIEKALDLGKELDESISLRISSRMVSEVSPLK